MNKELNAFLSLIKAGLWETDTSLLSEESIEWAEIIRLAEEQTVIGLVTAGMDYISGIQIPKEVILYCVGATLSIEKRNKEMNAFVSWAFKELQNEGIFAILMKGQGVANCYKRPLWRSPGDVDLLLDTINYSKSILFFSKWATSVEREDLHNKHISILINNYNLELHGTHRSGIGRRVDKIIDLIQEDTFKNNQLRYWDNNGVRVFLPAHNNDIFFVFCHILQHFFRGGIGLRQVCDWIMLIWFFRDDIDVDLLKKRLIQARIVTEWKVFASMAVNFLDFPQQSMPLYDKSKKWKRKSAYALSLIMTSGNFGHNRDMSYHQKFLKPVTKTISFAIHTLDILKLMRLFPLDAIRNWFLMIHRGFIEILNGR